MLTFRYVLDTVLIRHRYIWGENENIFKLWVLILKVSSLTYGWFSHTIASETPAPSLC
ncbi:unnamed protein product, partial [Prunus brigantina]